MRTMIAWCRTLYRLITCMAKRRVNSITTLLGICVVHTTFWFVLHLTESIPNNFTKAAHQAKKLVMVEKELVTDGKRDKFELPTSKGITSKERDKVPLLSDTERAKSFLTKQGSLNKSIVFLKTFKVGGTTISSMLIAYAFNKQLNIGPIGRVCIKGRRSHRRMPHRNLNQRQHHANIRKPLAVPKVRGVQKRHIGGRQEAHGNSPHRCSHIFGTNHPIGIPCLQFNLTAAPSLYCHAPEAFIMLRDPKERLWSGYRHEVKLAEDQFPLQKFLDSRTIVKTASNYLLSADLQTATKMASSMNILWYHLYDESLVYMAMKTGLNLCDIMYVPCANASWGATKCNTDTSIIMSDSDREALTLEVSKTGEQKFYDFLLNSTESRLLTPDIANLTKLYRDKKRVALKHCNNPQVIKDIVFKIRKTRGVTLDKAGNYHYQVERTNPLDPMTVCLTQYCTTELL